MDQGEQQPLLTQRKTEPKNGQSVLTPFNYIILNILIAIFSAAQILESKVSPLYIYQYLNDHLNSNSGNDTNSSLSNSNNVSNITNGCGGSTKAESDAHEVQSEETLWLWYFSITDDCIVFFIIIGMGCCSDYIGRKPFIILSLLGHSVIYFTKAYIIYNDLGISFFLITAAISGASSTSLFHISCMAIVADTTKPDKSRSVGVAVIDMATALGYTVTQLASGYLVQNTGYVFPCILSGGICFFSVIAMCLFVPETLKKDKNIRYSMKESFKNFIGFYHNKKYLKENGSIWKFNFVVLILIVYKFQSTSISTVYLIGPPFCWSAEAIAWHSFAGETMHLLLNVPLLKLLHLCIHDAAAGFLGCISAIVCKVIYGFASESWMLYLATGTGILSALPLTVLKALMSRMVHKDYQGALFANIYIIATLCSMGSLSILNNVYRTTQNFMPGFVYLVTAGVTLLTAIIFIPLIFVNRKMSTDRSADVTIRHKVVDTVSYMYSTNKLLDVDGQAHMLYSEQTGF